MINNAPEIDLSNYYNKSETYARDEVYNKIEVDQLISDAVIGEIDISNYYSKTETDKKLDTKANVADIIDAYNKTETDTLLDAKADKTELIDAYNKTETDSKLDTKANVTDIIDAYNKTETNTLLDAKADKTELIDAYNKIETNTLLDAKADKTELIDAYNKTETDEKLDLKADKTELIDAYNKTETDTLLDAKADKTELIDAYSKTEDDALLLLKADQSTTYSKSETYSRDEVYTKTETDSMLNEKVDKTELDEYVDLTSVQTITVKNDASILLAGGGDMLVSSLVSQPQLQEVRDIASGKSKGYVFATTQEMNTWMEDQENVAKLAIGDNLYIVDKEVMDYWWDGTNLRALETELPDMSNVVTALGAATGNGNAITDISIDGNTITPAKNETFVTTGFDQSITGMKTFTSTIISNGIQYSGYDNNSVFLAGGGVKSISDIVSTVDLTDYYNKTKIDQLLGEKADATELSNYYDKHDVDEMVNDANELIRAVEDQIPPPATISNFVQKTGEDLDQTIQGRLRQQLDERVPFDSMSDNLYITKFDALEGLVTSETFNDQLLDKADKTDLANYVTLDTAQSINANKTFNNACRFTSTIDGMSSITGQQFVKSGADNTVVLLGAGGTKPISEFTTSIDDSNYVKKTGETSQTIDGSLKKTVLNSQDVIDNQQYMAKYEIQSSFVQKQAEAEQYIEGILRKTTLDQPYPEPTDDDYVTLGAVKSEFVSSIYSGSINGNLTANQFIKSDGTNQQLLLANGSTKPLSDFVNQIDSQYFVDRSTDQTIGGNKVFSLEVRAPTFKLPGYSSDY
ncbi:MAG: hypothetical protein EZS28_033663, partial [Streblomastix strix]